MADQRNPGNDIESDDSTRMDDDEVVGMADDGEDDEDFEDIEDEDDDEAVEEGE